MRWRALPIFTVLAIATVMFWGLLTVFGSESSDEELPSVTAAGSSDLPRIPLVFPEVAKPMIEALPSPEPSPEPPAIATAAKKPATTKARAVEMLTESTTGNAVTDESGDPTIGPNRSTSAGDDSDPVGDLDDGFENPDDFGPDEPDDEPEPPEEPEEPDVDDEEPSGSGGVSSGDSGNNGANGSDESQSDPGNSEGGDGDEG